MKIASFNVNGVNGRLPVLLRWLEEARPDVVCLQELKAPDQKFPRDMIEKAGYGAIWHGQKSWNGVAILGRGKEPIETRRGLPRDPEDSHSRYIEAAIDGMIVGCLYLPNGNPAIVAQGLPFGSLSRSSTASCLVPVRVEADGAPTGFASSVAHPAERAGSPESALEAI
jgi:exodeoxyribonuclease III